MGTKLFHFILPLLQKCTQWRWRC